VGVTAQSPALRHGGSSPSYERYAAEKILEYFRRYFMNTHLLVRKKANELYVGNSIPPHTWTERILEFQGNGVSCSATVDEETFNRVTVGKRYWVNIDELLESSSDYCQGLGPHTTSDLRLMPYGGGRNVLCRSCWSGELYWRQIMNLEGGNDELYELPAWETAEVYAGNGSSIKD